MRRVCASYSGADARTKGLKNVKIVIKNRVSEEFRKEVESALDSFPSYYNLLETTIALGPRIKNIFPDIRSDWRNLVMMHRGATDTIGLSEYGRCSDPPFLVKNTCIAEGIAHETGHAFDLRVFGDVANWDYFSLQPDQPFLEAWESDIADLLDKPELYASLHKEFQRHLKTDGSGTKETFAELWTNAHGHSALNHVGISEIQSYFPRSAKIVEDCISIVQNTTSPEIS